MRSILVHARHFSIESICPSNRPQHIVQRRNHEEELTLCNALLAFVTVEKHDDKGSATSMAREIGKVLNRLQDVEKRPVAIIPFAHLSKNLMNSVSAYELLLLINETMSVEHPKNNITLGDFGFGSKWSIEAHSHPLSCIYRET